MSGYAHRVLTFMREGIWYRPCDIAKTIGIDVGEVSKTLRLLSNGGLVDAEEGHGYRRKKVYKTKQKSLFDYRKDRL